MTQQKVHPLTGLAAFLLAVAAAIVGCGDSQTLENEGDVCIVAGEGSHGLDAQELSAGVPLFVSYVASGCLTSSDTDLEASCEVRVVDDEIRVTSRASWTARSRLSGEDICMILSATCEVPALTEGTYVVRHGEDSLTLEVPSSHARAPCTSGGFR